MNEDVLRELYLEWIEDYCNRIFDKNNLPGGVVLALNLLIEDDPMDYNLASEKLSDMSKTYATNEAGIPTPVIKWLSPYRGAHVIGAGKRPYYGS